jgi:antitoxin HicB
MKTNPHIGSTFESWLDEAGIREEVTAAAVKSVIAAQIGEEMKKQHITKARMAEMMKPAAPRSIACSTPRTAAPRSKR